MNILKNLFLFNKKSEKNKEFSPGLVDQSLEIAKLVKEARIQQNLTIKELSYISKIPERIINSIENNNKSTRPEYPFIRSILIKLEECLVLKKKDLKMTLNNFHFQFSIQTSLLNYMLGTLNCSNSNSRNFKIIRLLDNLFNL